MRRPLALLIPILVLLAACSLPSTQDMQGKPPIQITNEPEASTLDRLGCVMGIQGTAASLYGTYKALREGNESDTGLAPMVNNDGLAVIVNVRNPDQWKKVATYGTLAAANLVVTANECRYSLFSGTVITYWCGSEHLLRRTDGRPMYANEYDFFFHSYACFNGWAYYGENWWADPYYTCRITPGWCIRYDDNG